MRRLGHLFDPALPVNCRVFFVLAATIVVLDQLTKILSAAYLKGRSSPLTLIPNFLQLTYDTNTGAAFSLMQDRTALLAVFSAAITIFIIIWALRLKREEWGYRIAMGLILGGAVGNLIDRVRLSYVIDFISAHWRHKAYWPTFNVADSAVCVGMALFVLISFRTAHPPAPVEKESKPAQPPHPNMRKR